jgi:hypothetical protein
MLVLARLFQLLVLVHLDDDHDVEVSSNNDPAKIEMCVGDSRLSLA